MKLRAATEGWLATYALRSWRRDRCERLCTSSGERWKSVYRCWMGLLTVSDAVGSSGGDVLKVRSCFAPLSLPPEVNKTRSNASSAARAEGFDAPSSNVTCRFDCFHRGTSTALTRWKSEKAVASHPLRLHLASRDLRQALTSLATYMTPMKDPSICPVRREHTSRPTRRQSHDFHSSSSRKKSEVTCLQPNISLTLISPEQPSERLVAVAWVARCHQISSV